MGQKKNFCLPWKKPTHNFRPHVLLSYHSVLESLVTKWLMHCFCIHSSDLCSVSLKLKTNSNEKKMNWKVLDIFDSYYFGLCHFSI